MGSKSTPAYFSRSMIKSIFNKRDKQRWRQTISDCEVTFRFVIVNFEHIWKIHTKYENSYNYILFAVAIRRKMKFILGKKIGRKWHFKGLYRIEMMTWNQLKQYVLFSK